MPVYSIFRGAIGAVDKHLANEGRLVPIESVQDVHGKRTLIKRVPRSVAESTSKQTLHYIVDTIQQIAESRDGAMVRR